MQLWKIPDAPSQQYGILLFDQFSNHCLANFIEPLRAVNGFTGETVYDWQILTLDGGPVTSSSGIPIMPHGRLRDARGDALVLMPSYGYRAFATPAMDRALRAAATRFQTLIGLDTGAWLLAHAGLLDHGPATIHTSELDVFAERFPDVDVQRDRFVIGETRITAGGAMAAFDLVHHLIVQRHGAAIGLQVADLFMLSDQAIPTQSNIVSRDKYVLRALAEMNATLAEPVTVAAIAARSGLRQRDLELRCRKAFGTTPAQVYRRLRLTLAHRLIREEKMSIAEIALRCGYEDASSFARAFKGEFDQSPTDLRR
ncbi:GlxA family transcriptional regulator [Aestuariibius sp. HNIBRBA575]|uniref:GlxA family transcriptional regulator n=1 Tax=Aestuariibius sp. HNIBRBA575 TaxID=3233343 RepID=UPI0034A21FED